MLLKVRKDQSLVVTIKKVINKKHAAWLNPPLPQIGIIYKIHLPH